MVDKKLVKRAKRGNKEALLTLIMNKKDEYYRLAFSYMGNEQDAMDAMEDMIVSLYEKIYQLRKDESFDALPDSIQTLELDVEGFIGYQSVGETIPIHSEEHIFRIGETDVQIVDISVISDRVMVSIQTEKSIILDGVAIVVDGRKIPVENIRQEENLKDGTFMCNQTMIFDSTNLPESLYVDGIYYKKNYHQRIEIPVK